MTANIYIPLWPFGVAFIALCLLPDLTKIVRRLTRRHTTGARTGAHPRVPVRSAGGTDWRDAA